MEPPLIDYPSIYNCQITGRVILDFSHSVYGVHQYLMKTHLLQA